MPSNDKPRFGRRLVQPARAVIARLLQPQRNRRVLGWVAIVAVLVPVSLWVIYPRVGEWVIRHRLMPRLEQKLGQRISVEDIEVSLGHATLRNINTHNTMGQGINTIARLDLDFSVWRSLVGSIRLQSATVAHAELRISERQLTQLRAGVVPSTTLPANNSANNDATSATAGLRAMLPGQILLHDVSLQVGTRGHVALASLRYDSRNHTARVDDITASGTWHGTPITVQVATAMMHHTSLVTFENASVTAPFFQVSHMAGTLRRKGRDGSFNIRGDYPSTAVVGWRVQGELHDAGQSGAATVTTTVATSVATSTPHELQVTLTAPEITFAGAMAFAGLQFKHPAIAAIPITDVAFSVDLRGSYHRASRVLELPIATIHKDQVDVAVAGTMQLTPPRRIDARITVPPVACQAALLAVPRQLIPALVGYQLAGSFALEIRGAIRSDDLAASTLESTGGLAGCTVVAAPRNSPSKLTGAFSHRVEMAPHVFKDFVVGSGNPAFVEYDAIPDYVLSSLIETEDPSFMEREQFAAPGMARALLENLRTGSLRVGGSTIPMQVAKNLFLDGQRTLSRKLQELLLAWHIESTLPRYRILEIYLNIIEFGPGIYGLGDATRELFDKPVHELMPVDAAYFSAIIPRPRFSYQNFCTSQIDSATLTRMQRALTLLVNEGKLSVEDWRAATSTPVVFAVGKSSAAECMERRRQALTMFESH